MQFVVTVFSSCIIFLAIGGALSAQQELALESPDMLLTSLPVCSEDNSVCNILIKNESTNVDEIEQVCACARGKLCPSTVSKANTIRFLDSEWFVTCASLDTIPACEAGQVSLFSQMESLDEPVNFQVKCTCPGGYDTNGALWRLDGTKVLVEIYCNDNQNAHESHEDYGDDNINDIENEDQKEMKRSRDNSAFYKRGQADDLYYFYKRGGPNVSGFYKRGLGSLQSFYKRAPFYKRAQFYKRSAELRSKVAPSKRSVHYYKTFYKRAPFRNLNAFYKKDFIPENSLGLDKKNYGPYSFYKRGFNNNEHFYKRGRFGINSFYKRAQGHPNDLTTADNDDENLSVFDEMETGDGTSFVNKRSSDGRVRFLFKPYTVLGRHPWQLSVGTRVDHSGQDAESYRH